jgi:hypothetical protein
MTTQTKEALLAQIEPLKKKLRKLEEKEENARAAALVGKCFTYRDTYGGDSKPKHWRAYLRVLRADQGSLVCLKFERRPGGLTIVNAREYLMPHTIESYQRISIAVFNNAARDLIGAIGDALSGLGS